MPDQKQPKFAYDLNFGWWNEYSRKVKYQREINYKSEDFTTLHNRVISGS